MKKILIFYASYGGGHLSAANSIKEYIEDNYSDIEIKLVDCMEYVNKSLNKVTTTAYIEMAKKAPWVWGKVYSKSKNGVFSQISQNSNKLFAKKLNNLFIDYTPDLIISTHPFSSQMCAYLKKKNRLHTKIATIMTDYAPHEQWLIGSDYIDYYFVAHEGMKKALVNKGIDKVKIFTTGIPLSTKFLAHFNKEEILSYFDLDANKLTILFFAGGKFGLGKSKTYEMLRTFAKAFNHIQVVAISGKNPKMKKNFEEIVHEYHKEDNIKIIEYTNKVPELMSISDLVVTKPGGLTTTESLASGLPIIIISPLPGQEEENAEFLEKNHLAIWIKKGDNTKEILSKILEDSNLLQKMKVNARLFAKKNSCKDICKILLTD